MDIFIQILKGFLIGICASVPLGPVGILVIQKSLGYGQKTGFVTGLGAALLDVIYAVIAIFFLARARRFLEANTILILIVGGLVVIAVGVIMFFQDPFRKLKEDKQDSKFSMSGFFQAIAICASNPGAILIMFGLFAFFRVDTSAADSTVGLLLLAVAAGSVAYWFLFSWAFGRWSRKLNLRTLLWINRVFGILLFIIGIVMLADGVYQLIFRTC